MDTYEYDCDYCGKKFKPRRRYIQRFCSTSCRVGSHNRGKKISGEKADQKLPIDKKENEKKGITGIGIVEASIGSLAADGIKSLLTSPENKLVTNGNLDAAVSEIVKRVKTEILLAGLGQSLKSSPQQKKEDDNDFGSGWV